ncbi:2,3,4,5-tetrahydropyridine-2,6-dicarboxylate N-succinyltransferase [Novosphingobium panipatense]
MSDLAAKIEAAFDARDTVTPASEDVRQIVDEALELLDAGKARVAEKVDGEWVVNQWLKKAVLLSFRLNDNGVMDYGAAGAPAFDKVPLKFAGWDESRFKAAGVRVVPGAVVRRSAHVSKGVVLMPSFVNLGAYIGEGTMVDTWATVGSCAQIGRNVHISGGAGIGGVLEPSRQAPSSSRTAPSSAPARKSPKASSSARVRFSRWACSSVPRPRSSTVRPAKSTSAVSPYAVVVPGAMPGKPLADGTPGPSLYCAVIVKTVDAQTRSKTGINELLRD